MVAHVCVHVFVRRPAEAVGPLVELRQQAGLRWPVARVRQPAPTGGQGRGGRGAGGMKESLRLMRD